MYGVYRFAGFVGKLCRENHRFISHPWHGIMDGDLAASNVLQLWWPQEYGSCGRSRYYQDLCSDSGKGSPGSETRKCGFRRYVGFLSCEANRWKLLCMWIYPGPLVKHALFQNQFLFFWILAGLLRYLFKRAAPWFPQGQLVVVELASWLSDGEELDSTSCPEKQPLAPLSWSWGFTYCVYIYIYITYQTFNL